MVQKVIKIGSSLGVTIPKNRLDELGIGLGDEVKVSIAPVSKDKNQQKLMREYSQFVKQYGRTLKNLASK